MHPITKKQKILYILAAAGFVLLALAMLLLLLSGGISKKADTEPTATPIVTPTPSADTGLTIAGVSVDPAADSLELTDKTLTDADRSAIASLTNLTTLSLTRCGLTDVNFLTGLTQLRSLYLSDNSISDASPLASIPSLRTVYLDRNPVADITPLTALPSLTTLSVQGVEIADYVLEDFEAALPGCRVYADSIVEGVRPLSLGGLDFTEGVETLDLSNRGVTDISSLSGCGSLRELNLSGNAVADISPLAKLPKLTSLNLSSTGRSDADFDILASLTSLSYLNLENNEDITAECIDKLQTALPNCQIVHEPKYYTVTFGETTLKSDASDVTIDALGLTSLSGIEKFLNLRRLSAYGNQLTTLTPLAEVYSIEELQLGYNNITDISALAYHTGLRKLDLDHNALSSVSALASCTGLEELDLSYNALTSLTELYGCTSLRTLDLTGNSALTADAIRALQAALPSCQIVTDIDLSMPEPTPAPPTEG